MASIVKCDLLCVHLCVLSGWQVSWSDWQTAAGSSAHADYSPRVILHFPP